MIKEKDRRDKLIKQTQKRGKKTKKFKLKQLKINNNN